MPLRPLLTLAIVLVPLAAFAADQPKPTSRTDREIEGWTVRVDDRLLKGDDAKLGERALKCLECQLHSVALVLPEDKVRRLREVPIWLDRSHGGLVSMQYHPSAGWLADHGYARELAKGVHIPDAKYFAAAPMQRQQPWAILHELAHAYHDQVLSFEHKEIATAWEAFVKGGKYKSVLHVSGKERPHYALTNRMEFFAEMTEAYFGQNDFFPFNSGELKREEPELFELMEKVWGKLP